MDTNEKVKQFCVGCHYNDKGTCRYGEECAGTVYPRRCEAYVHQ
jgi:hypothetical protein